MVAFQFLHGIEVDEVDDGIRPIPITATAVVGLIGTAPDADLDAFPHNYPVPILGNPRMAAGLDTTGNGLGTLYDAVQAVFLQASATIIVVNVAQGVDVDHTISNIVGDPIAGTGVWAFLHSQAINNIRPKLLCAPGYTGKRMVNGLTDVILTQIGRGYAPPPALPPIVHVADTGSPGAGAGAQVVCTVDVDGQIDTITIRRSGSNYTNPVVTLDAPVSGISPEGVQATATAIKGHAANAVVAEMEGIAERIRAVILADGPNTTDEDVITWRNDWGSKRIYVIDPYVLAWDILTSSDVPRPPSPYVAGVINYMDKTQGFWWSPSNQILNGVTGISRPIDFNISDSSSEANYLNENDIATVINYDGYRLWGNRVTATDPLWTFLSVRRTCDAVYDSIEAAFLWAIDRPFSAQLLVDIAGSVNAFLRTLQAYGAIIDGKSWLDPTLNSPTQMQQGILVVDFDIEPPAPLEHLVFRAHRNGKYYIELVDQAIITMNQQVATAIPLAQATS